MTPLASALCIVATAITPLVSDAFTSSAAVAAASTARHQQSSHVLLQQQRRVRRRRIYGTGDSSLHAEDGDGLEGTAGGGDDDANGEPAVTKDIDMRAFR